MKFTTKQLDFLKEVATDDVLTDEDLLLILEKINSIKSQKESKDK